VFNAVEGCIRRGRPTAAVSALQRGINQGQGEGGTAAGGEPEGKLVHGDHRSRSRAGRYRAAGRKALEGGQRWRSTSSARTGGAALLVAKGTRALWRRAGTELATGTDMCTEHQKTRGSGEFVHHRDAMATGHGKNIRGLCKRDEKDGQTQDSTTDGTADGADLGDRGNRAGCVDGAEPGPWGDVHSPVCNAAIALHIAAIPVRMPTWFTYPSLAGVRSSAPGPAAIMNGWHRPDSRSAPPLGDCNSDKNRHDDAEPDERGTEEGR